MGDKNKPDPTGIEVQIFASHGEADNRLGDHDAGGLMGGPGIRPIKNAAKPDVVCLPVPRRSNRLLPPEGGSFVGRMSSD
jgi:hypothetical protein